MPSQGRTFASVERFLAEVINHRAHKGQTPLMLACANGCSPLETPPCPRLVHKALEPKGKAIRFRACSLVRSFHHTHSHRRQSIRLPSHVYRGAGLRVYIDWCRSASTLHEACPEICVLGAQAWRWPMHQALQQV